MTMNLLRQIAGSRLPVSFHRREEIDSVRVLRAAGLVIALVPAPSDALALSGSRPAAQVLAITEGARRALEVWRPESASFALATPHAEDQGGAFRMATSSVLGACKSSSSRERVKEPLGRRLTPFALEDRRPEQTHEVLKVQTSRSVSVA